ncbi:DUF2188 domain-containing protein [Sphingomicrobium arenosum]|uniref:DUF2188 domain-containing protein n=1 Tax=Sphingomicrobium arenosum TaxID=2233861 RepID=UPI002240EE51|nr:DUF2188 domain-containing protein [Sphingomicrobium arenosum]
MADNIWCTPHADGWQVKRAGGERASSLHETQAEAWDEARRMGRADKVEVFLQGEDGQIRERHSYGNDPERFPG